MVRDALRRQLALLQFEENRRRVASFAKAAGYLTGGICADLLQIVSSEHELVVGEVVLTELRRVLETRMRLPTERVDEVEKFLRTYEVVAKPDAIDPIVVRDEADTWVLANARAGQTDVLITENDLLAVAATAGVHIVTPREFWEELRRGARQQRGAVDSRACVLAALALFDSAATEPKR